MPMHQLGKGILPRLELSGLRPDFALGIGLHAGLRTAAGGLGVKILAVTRPGTEQEIAEDNAPTTDGEGEQNETGATQHGCLPGIEGRAA